MEYIDEPTGVKEVLVILDRVRTVTYDGEKVMMNTFECTSCGMLYYFEMGGHQFCPFCGTRYRFASDVSV